MSNIPEQNMSGKYGPDTVREMPNIMLGSRGLKGALHCFIEIMGNALDEAASGFGDKIDVVHYEDGAISIRDYGRGVPMGWGDNIENEDGSLGAWYWDKIFNTLYFSGKYEDKELNDRLLSITDWDNFDPSEFPYLFSVGVHGVGATATQFCSAYFEVRSYDGENESYMRFEEGHPVLDELQVTPSRQPRGTFIKFLPDNKVFDSVDIPTDWLLNQCWIYSVTGEVEFKFTKPSGEKVEMEARPLQGYLQETYGEDILFDHTLHHTEVIDRTVTKAAIATVDAMFAPSNTPGEDHQFFNNRVELHGGVHSDATDVAVSKFFREVIKDNYGLKVIQDDYYSVYTVFVSTQSNLTNYTGQTKDSQNDAYVYEAIYNNLSHQLSEAWRHKVPWLVKMVKLVAERADNRLAQKTKQEDIKKIKRVLKKEELPSNFIECLNYSLRDYDDVEIILTEGDSAASSARQGRDGQTQCILPLKGKGLNVYKSTPAKAIANKEILGLVQVLGCGIDTGDDSTFDIRKLRCSKIIIASDADVDGFHIRNLLFLVFYKFFPELLYQNKVFVAETPRFGIKRKDGTVEYCRDDEEYKAALERDSNYVHVSRYKGLGEVDPQVLSETTLYKDTRKLIPLSISTDDMELHRSLEVMFGDDASLRKSEIIDVINSGGYEEFAHYISKLVEDEKSAIKSTPNNFETIYV